MYTYCGFEVVDPTALAQHEVEEAKSAIFHAMPESIAVLGDFQGTIEVVRVLPDEGYVKLLKGSKDFAVLKRYRKRIEALDDSLEFVYLQRSKGQGMIAIVAHWERGREFATILRAVHEDGFQAEIERSLERV